MIAQSFNFVRRENALTLNAIELKNNANMINIVRIIFATKRNALLIETANQISIVRINASKRNALLLRIAKK